MQNRYANLCLRRFGNQTICLFYSLRNFVFPLLNSKPVQRHIHNLTNLLLCGKEGQNNLRQLQSEILGIVGVLGPEIESY